MRDTVFLSYSVEAEARCFNSLGLNPLDFKWIDLYLEYRMLLNHNNELSYGKQLIDGKVRVTHPPERGSSRLLDNSRPSYSLAAALYKMLKIRIDTEHKEVIRNIIIHKPYEVLEENKDAILAYCESDTKYLPLLWEKIKNKNFNLFGPTYIVEAMNRGMYAAITALRTDFGYPVDLHAVKSLVINSPLILHDAAVDFNKQFPDKKVYLWNKRTQSFTKKIAPIVNYIVENKLHETWMKTKTGRLCLDQEAMEKGFPYETPYPRGVFGAQLLEQGRIRRNLNGFLPANKEKSFLDYVGPDGRARPFMGIFGTMTGRSAPKATGFIPSKSRWMRVLIKPPNGRFLCGIDYSSQEFLIAALLAQDDSMYKAYHSGDPYLWMLREVEGPGKDHLRPKYKQAMLSLMYGIGPGAMADNLKITREDAETLINNILGVFWVFDDWRNEIRSEYIHNGYLKIADGWTVWGDNPNPLSVANFPVQGTGGAIMRKADELCWKRGLKIPFTLHDALYMEADTAKVEENILLFKKCMEEAFMHFFPGELIRVEGMAWSPEFTLGHPNMGEWIEFLPEYSEKQIEEEIINYKKYLNACEGITSL
jgi:hypothetical protein